MDLDAPIIPGRSAAGYELGMPLEAIPPQELALFQPSPYRDAHGQPTDGRRYEATSVVLYVDPDGRIGQIGVRAGYRGKLLERIGVGMTIAAIERLIGPVALDEEDVLTIFGLWGLCLELDWHPPLGTPHLPGGYPDFSLPQVQGAHVVWLFVFRVENDWFPWMEALHYVPKEALHRLPEDALINVPEELLLGLPEEVLVHLPAPVVQHFPEAVRHKLPSRE